MGALKGSLPPNIVCCYNKERKRRGESLSNDSKKRSLARPSQRTQRSRKKAKNTFVAVWRDSTGGEGGVGERKHSTMRRTRQKKNAKNAEDVKN